MSAKGIMQHLINLLKKFEDKRVMFVVSGSVIGYLLYLFTAFAIWFIMLYFGEVGFGTFIQILASFPLLYLLFLVLKEFKVNRYEAVTFFFATITPLTTLFYSIYFPPMYWSYDPIWILFNTPVPYMFALEYLIKLLLLTASRKLGIKGGVAKNLP